MTILLLIAVALLAGGGLLLSRKSRLLGFGSFALGLLIAAWALVTIAGSNPGEEGVAAPAAAPPPPSRQDPSRAPAPAGEASRIVVCPGDPRCPKQ